MIAMMIGVMIGIIKLKNLLKTFKRKMTNANTVAVTPVKQTILDKTIKNSSHDNSAIEMLCW